MKLTTTIRVKNDLFTFATETANKYYLSRSTIINIAIASLSKSKFRDRYIKQAIARNTQGNKTKTTWSTNSNLMNLVKVLASKNECNYTEIVAAGLLYIRQNAIKPKYLDLKFSKVVERNKVKWKRSHLI